MASPLQKIIFLDRDGTINVDDGFVHDIASWRFVEGAIEGLKGLNKAGFKLVVITNQSGIGHGMYQEADMNLVHDHMREELRREGVSLAAIVFCPHRRDAGCDCRKPKTGMAEQVKKQLGAFALYDSWTIGDKEADVGFGQKVGTKTALIRSRYWQENNLVDEPDLVVDSLAEFARRVTENE